jgi:ABC-type uncharacterized transport system permease subunit
MTETNVLWLRVAAALYSFGLLDAVFLLTRQRDMFFRPALAAFGLGGLFHLVSIVEQGLLLHRFPVDGIFQTLSLCGFLITVCFLFVYWRYRTESLSVFIFPLVFVLTLVAGLSNNFPGWSSPATRGLWLSVHIVLILIGYAALLFTAVAAVAYLFQESELKRKKPRGRPFRLPPLGTLDDLISSSLRIGFICIKGGIVVGSIWACVDRGTGWITDPRIVISFVTWAIYLALVFFRSSAGWRGRKAAILAIAALFCSVATWVTHIGILSQ